MARNSKIKSYHDAIMRAEEIIKQQNTIKSETYKAAKSEGYDPKIMRKAFAIKKNGVDKHEEEEEAVREYLNELG